MTLTDEDLNAVDRRILALLAEGRATPTLIQRLLAEQGDEFSRQYVNQRLKRFAEHGHVRNLFDTGVYELVKDPRA